MFLIAKHLCLHICWLAAQLKTGPSDWHSLCKCSAPVMLQITEKALSSSYRQFSRNTCKSFYSHLLPAIKVSSMTNKLRNCFLGTCKVWIISKPYTTTLWSPFWRHVIVTHHLCHSSFARPAHSHSPLLCSTLPILFWPQEADLYGKREVSALAVPLRSGFLQKKLEGRGENWQPDALPSSLPPDRQFLFLLQDSAVLLSPAFPLLILAQVCSQTLDT